MHSTEALVQQNSKHMLRSFKSSQSNMLSRPENEKKIDVWLFKISIRNSAA